MFKYLFFIFSLTCSTYLSALIPALYTNSVANIEDRRIQIAINHSNVSQQESSLIAYIESAIKQAEAGNSNLPNEIMQIEGMSSPKNRYFLNHLCQLPNTRYLEIGCWKGSTFISALYHNKKSIVSATAIDNWSEFGGPAADFQTNCQKFISDIPYRSYSHDSFSKDPKTFIQEKINIYFYDGNHEQQAQALAFLYYNNVFDDSFIAIVDDWNWESVRAGTFEAFKKLDYQILYEASLPSLYNQDLTGYWNGLYVAVIRKKA